MDVWKPMQQLFDMLYSQIVNIPLDNPLSAIYVVLNIGLLLMASVLNGVLGLLLGNGGVTGF